MSWFTKIISKLKIWVNDSVTGKKEYKPIVVADEYMRFYRNTTVLYNETFARKSLLTGEYIPVFYSHRKDGDLYWGGNIKASFDGFAEAYDAFCYLEQKYQLNSSQLFSIYKSLLIIFNKRYSSTMVLRYKNFIHDYPKYFRVVQLMLAYDLPVLVRADLYRQVSMFKKSVELLNNVHFNTPFERELCDEIRFRACNNIRHPFMIYDVDNLKEFFPDPNRPTYLDWFFYVYYELS